MKNLKLITTLIMSLLILSCSQDEQAVDEVFDTVTKGAVLRTTASSGGSLNLLDPSAIWAITIEEQDAEDGELLSEVNVFVGFTDGSEENGVITPDEAQIQNIQASEFGVSVFGLPETNISFTFSDALTALGLDVSDVRGGDFIVFRLELVLTDGRTFTANQASGTISQSFFASPFQYPLLLVCEVETPFTGNYTLTMADSFGDGWNGAAISVVIDDAATEYAISEEQATDAVHIVNVPDGSISLQFNWVSGDWDEEATFTIQAPSGNIIATGGPSQAEGLIGINLCNE